MKRACLGLSLCLFLALVSPGQIFAATICQHILIPAYFYPSPTTTWDQAIAAGPAVQYLVMDPDNGPGSFTDSNYVAITTAAINQGKYVLGYVYTNYSARSLAAVKADVDGYVARYPAVSGIFVDLISTGASDIPYVSDLVSYIKTKYPTGKVFLNFGTVPDPGFADLDAVMVLFEGTYSSYLTTTMPGWVYQLPASRVMNLVYGVTSSATFDAVQAHSLTLNAGYLFVNDSGNSYVWDGLPSYFAHQTQTIDATCATGISSPPNTPDPNRPLGWSLPIMAGPKYFGSPQWLRGDSPATSALSVFISPASTQLDLSLKFSPVPVYTPGIPVPWQQGWNIVSPQIRLDAFSAFNGFPVARLAQPYTLTLSYDPVLARGQEKRLRIIHFDPSKKIWRRLPAPIVRTSSASALSTTTTEFGIFVAAYPR